MTALNFVPVIISTLGLGIASFSGNKNWIMVAFVVWLAVFVLTLSFLL